MRNVVPLAWRRAQLDVPAVLLDDPEHHRQTQTGAASPLVVKNGSKTRSWTSALIPIARIGHLDDALPVFSDHSQTDGPATWQRIDRIEDEIGHQLAQACSRGALNGRMLPSASMCRADRPAFGLRRVTPARRRQLRRVAHHLAQIHALAVLFRRTAR